MGGKASKEAAVVKKAVSAAEKLSPEVVAAKKE